MLFLPCHCIQARSEFLQVPSSNPTFFLSLFFVKKHLETTPSSNKRNTRSVTSTQQMFSLNDIEHLISKAKSEMLSSFKDEITKISNSIEFLSEKIDTFDKRLSDLQSTSNMHEKQINELKSTIGTIQNNLTNEVSDEMEQRASRLQNIVITGVPELNEGTVEERRAHDEKKLGEILNEAGISNSAHYRVSRVGKPRQDRSRLMKVFCPDVKTKRMVLRNGKNLRSSFKFKSVYVNEDRTPMQQEQSRKLRAEMRRRREDGEDVVIFRSQIVQRGDVQNFH